MHLGKRLAAIVLTCGLSAGPRWLWLSFKRNQSEFRTCSLLSHESGLA